MLTPVFFMFYNMRRHAQTATKLCFKDFNNNNLRNCAGFFSNFVA